LMRYLVLVYLAALALVPVASINWHPPTSCTAKGSCRTAAPTDDCDRSLSFWEFVSSIPDHPEYGGTLYGNEQLACDSYNISVWFVEAKTGNKRFAYSRVQMVAPAAGAMYMDGFKWSDTVAMEAQSDPLYHTRERWFWATNRKTLVWDSVFEHHVVFNRTTHQLAYDWTNTMVQYTSSSPTAVARRGCSIQRRMVDAGDEPEISQSIIKDSLNKTAWP